MIDDLTIDGELFCVLCNDEDQHCIWPAAQPAPAGWHPVAAIGGKEQCLAYVEANWTDMRPKSLREKLLPSSPRDLPHSLSADPLKL